MRISIRSQGALSLYNAYKNRFDAQPIKRRCRFASADLNLKPHPLRHPLELLHEDTLDFLLGISKCLLDSFLHQIFRKWTRIRDRNIGHLKTAIERYLNGAVF